MTDSVYDIVIDTSALIAIAKREHGYQSIARAIYSNRCLIPEPARIEFMLVMTGQKHMQFDDAKAFLADLMDQTATTLVFDTASSDAAIAAIPEYGKRNGQGGKLNFGDLMVYGSAKATGLPILCTGKDFASTDALIHPASRIG